MSRSFDVLNESGAALVVSGLVVVVTADVLRLNEAEAVSVHHLLVPPP